MQSAQEWRFLLQRVLSTKDDFILLKARKAFTLLTFILCTFHLVVPRGEPKDFAQSNVWKLLSISSLLDIFLTDTEKNEGLNTPWFARLVKQF